MTYGVKVKLDVLIRGTNRDGSIVFKIGADIGQGNVAGGTSKDVDTRVTLVELGHLGSGVVLKVGVAGQGDGVTSLGRVRSSCNGRGIGEGQDRGGQCDKGGDLHCLLLS